MNTVRMQAGFNTGMILVSRQSHLAVKEMLTRHRM